MFALLEILRSRDILDVRARLEMIRRKGSEVRIVRVEHDVTPELGELDEVPFPGMRPVVRAGVRDDAVVDDYAYLRIGLRLTGQHCDHVNRSAEREMGEETHIGTECWSRTVRGERP